MGTIDELAVNVTANTADFRRGLDRAAGKLRQFDRKFGVSNAFTRLTKSINSAKVAFGGLIGVTSVAGGVAFGVKLAADVEKAETAFRTLLGSAKDANRLMKQLGGFAASTPFRLSDLRDAATLLAAFGFETNAIIPTLRMMGDLAAGVNQPIGELAELYGKARVQGRLFGEDINQLVGRGIPVIGEFAKQFGVSTAEVKKLVSEGKIGFPELQKAIESMTGEGGKFHDLMKELSGTTAGTYSTMRDNFDAILRSLGKAAIEGLNLRDHMQTLTKYLQESGPVLEHQFAKAFRDMAYYAQRINEYRRFYEGPATYATGGVTGGAGRLAQLAPLSGFGLAFRAFGGDPQGAAEFGRSMKGRGRDIMERRSQRIEALRSEYESQSLQALRSMERSMKRLERKNQPQTGPRR